MSLVPLVVGQGTMLVRRALFRTAQQGEGVAQKGLATWQVLNG